MWVKLSYLNERHKSCDERNKRDVNEMKEAKKKTHSRLLSDWIDGDGMMSLVLKSLTSRNFVSFCNNNLIDMSCKWLLWFGNYIISVHKTKRKTLPSWNEKKETSNQRCRFISAAIVFYSHVKSTQTHSIPKWWLLTRRNFVREHKESSRL